MVSATRASASPRRLLGVLTGNDRLQDEGEAQQARRRRAQGAREELKAQKEDTKAGALEQRQKAAPRAKAG